MSSKDHKTTKPRGVFERPAGSGVWWVNYYVAGKQRREKVGTKSAAIALYRKRKTQILEEKKLPELGRKEVTLGDLIDLALEFTADHKHSAGYRTKAKIVREAMGSRAAREILPATSKPFCGRTARHQRPTTGTSLSSPSAFGKVYATTRWTATLPGTSRPGVSPAVAYAS